MEEVFGRLRWARTSCALEPAHPEQMRFFTMILLLMRLRAAADSAALLRCLIVPIRLLVVAMLIVVGGAVPAVAQNRYWVAGSGGAFSSTASWSTSAGGASGASVPLATDTANFTLGGTYTASFSADVTNAALAVHNGVVTFDLNGNDYLATAANAVSIGTTVGATGRLIVRDGLLAVDTGTDTITLAAVANSSGFLTVTTAGRIGNGVIDPNLVVGAFGAGNLVVDDNGRIDAATISIGANEGSTGTVTIGSPNAVVDASGTVTVGGSGTATLTLQNAGILNTAGSSIVGSLLGANGTVSIGGVGTVWNQAGTAILGDAGDAGLTIQAGGTVATTGAVGIGSSASGIGTAVITGTDAIWTMASSLNVGAAGLGNLVVSSGGRASTAGVTVIANSAGSEGNVVITGTGSRWDAAAVTVGNNGAANLTIADGGVVNATGGLAIANAATSVGKTVVNGNGSVLNVAGALNVSGLGSGTLTVAAGGSIYATGALSLNDPAGAPVSTLNLNGGSITAAGFTRNGASVFNWTDGTLWVNGGTFSNSGANFTINGSDLDDSPILRLAAGAQATAANLPNLSVGTNRQGTVIVSGGSNLQTTTASFGTLDGGTGKLHVEGNNSTFATTGDLGVGGTTAAAGGLGDMTVGPGGTVAVGGTLRLWSGGTLNMAGGTLRFNALAANGGGAVFSAGTIQVTSTFNASSAVLDALLGPTHAMGAGRSIDTLTNAFNLQSDLSLVGGSVAGNTLSTSANVITRLESGSSGTFTNGISNPVGARIYVTDSTLSAGTTFTNNGELHLAGQTATVNATGIANSGLIDGSGRVNSVVTNNAAGQIRVAAGKRLEILGTSGTNTNNGLVDVDGGEIEFSRSITNSTSSPSSGLIAARSATLRFAAGLANSGAMTFSAGSSDVFGDVTNQNNLTTPGRIIVTGGATAIFYDDVTNSGSIQVSASGSLQSTAVFLGSLSGNGASGGGHVFLEGDTRPGFSPGTMSFGGDVSFGPFSTLHIELAGTAAGTQYDRVTIADSATLDGNLDVALLNGFKPAIGNSFQIVSATGGRAGTFANLALPALAGGANWKINYAANAVNLSVGGVLGDFNLDGRVDAADFSVWRDTFGSNSSAADASGNGTVDQQDYNIWKANFGAVAATGDGAAATLAAPVPESATIILAGTIGVLLLASRPTNRRSIYSGLSAT